MNTCSFCLQPGNVFPTGKPSQFSCAKCQPYVDNHSDDGSYPAMEPQVIVGDRSELPSGNDGSLFCTICNKTFDKNIQYQNHVRNHRAERKFVCPHCQKAFSQSNNLRAHLRIHTNERPFKCSECGKAFTQITNLNNHIRLHTGEKPYICKEPGCNRAFAQVTNLNNHKKSHMRDFMTFKCNMCFKTFAQRNHLVSHVQSEHETQICNACGETFPTWSALMLHVRNNCKERIRLEKRKLAENNEIMLRKKQAGAGGSIKCLFGDCKMLFQTMDQLQSHLASKHGLSLNKNKSEISKEVIELDDEDVADQSTTSSHLNSKTKPFEKMNGNISNRTASSSDSESSSSEEESDYRENERRKEPQVQQMKMVCSICFSTFDNSKLLEKHTQKSHQ